MPVSDHTIANARVQAVQNFPAGIGQVPQTHWRYFRYHGPQVVPSIRVNALHGMGSVPVHSGSDLAPREINKNSGKTLGYDRYGVQVRMDRYDLEEVPNLLATVPRVLGRAVAATKRAICHAAMSAAWTGTAVMTKPLIATNHVLDGGGARSNKVASAFDRAAVQAAKVLIRRWKTYEGLPDDWSSARLLCAVAPENESPAVEVFGSAMSSSEMQVNAIQGMAQFTVEDVFLATTDFLIVAEDNPPFDYFERRMDELDIHRDSDNPDVLKWNLTFAGGASAGPTPDGIVGGAA